MPTIHNNKKLNALLIIYYSLLATLIVVFAVKAFYFIYRIQLNNPACLPFINNTFYNFSKNILASHITSLPSYIDVHLTLIRYFLAPIYKIFPSINTLFIMQIIIIMSGAIPVYLIIKNSGKTTFTAATIGFFYIFNPFTTLYLFHDFRFLPLGIPFFLFSYLYYKEKKIWLFVIFSLLACSCREEFSLLYMSWFLFIHTHKEKKWIILPSLIGLLWYTIAYKLIYMSFLSTEGHLISHDLSKDWMLNLNSHIVFITEFIQHFKMFLTSDETLKYHSYFLIIILLFSFKKPLSLILLYIIGFFASFQTHILDAFVVSTATSSSSYYSAIAFLILFINFLSYAVSTSKNIVLIIVITLGFITSTQQISRLSDRPTDISLEEVCQFIEIVNNSTGKADNPNTILTDIQTSTVVSTHPYVFEMNQIPYKFPSIMTHLKNTKFIVMKKTNIPETIKKLLSTKKYIKTETENFIIIEMQNYIDTSFLIDK